MIDRNILTKLIDNQISCANYKDELKELTIKYPWFEHAHTLYTKALKETNDEMFEEKLLQTAVYSRDRENLFEIIMNSPAIALDAIEEIEENQVADDHSSKKKLSDFSNSSKEVSFEDETSKTISKETETESNDRLILNETETLDSLDIKQEEIAKKEIETENIDSVKEVDQKIVETSEQVSKEEIFQDEIELTPESKTLESQILSGAVSRVIEKEVEETHFKINDPTEIKEVESPALEISKTEVEYSSYTAWLVKRSRELDYKIEVSIVEEPQPLADGNFKLDTTVPIISDRKQRSKLIDNFIKNDPKITQGKAEEYNAVNMAKASLEPSDDFLTETMVKIYIQQGKISKAKQAYRLLSLKYPEKSIYFAARIKELDKKR